MPKKKKVWPTDKKKRLQCLLKVSAYFDAKVEEKDSLDVKGADLQASFLQGIQALDEVPEGAVNYTVEEAREELKLSTGNVADNNGVPFTSKNLWRQSKEHMSQLRNKVHHAFAVASHKGLLKMSGENVEDLKRAHLEMYWDLYGKKAKLSKKQQAQKDAEQVEESEPADANAEEEAAAVAEEEAAEVAENDLETAATADKGPMPSDFLGPIETDAWYWFGPFAPLLYKRRGDTEFCAEMSKGPATRDQPHCLKRPKGESGRKEQRAEKQKKGAAQLEAEGKLGDQFTEAGGPLGEAAAVKHNSEAARSAYLDAKQDYNRDKITKQEKLVALKEKMGLSVVEDQKQLLEMYMHQDPELVAAFEPKKAPVDLPIFTTPSTNTKE